MNIDVEDARQLWDLRQHEVHRAAALLKLDLDEVSLGASERMNRHGDAVGNGTTGAVLKTFAVRWRAQS